MVTSPRFLFFQFFLLFASISVVQLMSNSSVTASVAFIDLATYSESEGFLYGGCNAITWFVASVQKANWFSHVPICLRNIGTTAQFGACKASFSLSRQGDYVLSTFLRARFPAIGFNATISAITAPSGATVRWVDNLMHNLIKHVQIEFNDLQVQEFDSFWLDDNFEWRCLGHKRQGYLNMIGMVSTFTTPTGIGNYIPGGALNLPLPFFFGEDSGIALPVAALPFNDIKITYDFRDWKELVMVYPGTDLTLNNGGPITVSTVVQYENGVPTDSPPKLSCVETFAHYAIVHNDERVKMGDAPRDILIHQIQQTQCTPFKDPSCRSSFDIRLSHAIVLFTYKARNISLQNFFQGQYGYDQSNYTSLSTVLIDGSVNVTPQADPIAHTTLLYENTVRLNNSSDYFALVHPWYFSDAISETTGYHMHSYALKPWDPLRPSGSTNYSKLANVSIAHEPSFAMTQAYKGYYEDVSLANPTGTEINWPNDDTLFKQSWEHIFAARNWNIFRIANGSAGFPSL